MKLIFSLLLFMSASFLSAYAEQISYAYDKAGNRIKREIVINTRDYGTRATDGKDMKDIFYSEMLSEKEIRVYPNPTVGDLSVEIIGYEDADKCSFQIFDMSGSRIASASAESPVTHVDITGRPDGLYILNIVINGKQSSWKIIKK